MMYKAFAGITLVAAPVLVLLAQNLVPATPEPIATVAAPPITSEVMPQPQPTPPVQMAPAAPVAEPAAFGQPMSDAGKPFLSPGNGLPAAPSPASEVAPDGESDREP